MLRLNAFVAVSVICGCLFAVENADAAFVTSPTSLNSGDQYRLVFVTSGTRDGQSDDIADYNSFVQSAADSVAGLSSLGATWSVIGSTPTVDARDNTATNPSSTGVPIFLLNDTKLADNNADLWDGTVDVPLNFTEIETVLPGGVTIYTGTRSDGTADAEPLGPVGGGVRVGTSGFTGSTWVAAGGQNRFAGRHFFAISSVLTAQSAAVPEPSSLALLGIGAIGLIAKRRRKRKQAA